MITQSSFSLIVFSFEEFKYSCTIAYLSACTSRVSAGYDRMNVMFLLAIRMTRIEVDPVCKYLQTSLSPVDLF